MKTSDREQKLVEKSDSLQESMIQAKVVARELAVAREEFETTLENFETQLIGLAMEIGATITMNGDSRLSFGRNPDGIWRLVVASKFHEKAVPMAEASRFLRIQASHHLESLLAAIIGKAAHEIEETREAIAITNKLLGKEVQP